ncbi:MAG: hypothetical protein ABSD92_01345 [Candidatus Bathyarchaeia archaeon]|jgi:hypothetical protein
MAELPSVTSERKTEVIGRIKEYPEICKNYEDWIVTALESKDPRGYPLVRQFLASNKTFLSYFEEILKPLSSVKGFDSIVKYSKNKNEFYDELSVLKLALFLKALPCNFEFLPQRKNAMPDIRADLWGKDTFFEVKHLKEIDEVKEILLGYFAEYPSSFYLSIIFNWGITAFQTKQLIEIVTDLMKKNPEEKNEQRVDLDFAEVRIVPSKKRAETPLMFNVGIEGAPFKNNYRKVETLLSEAVRQFQGIPPDSPSFASFDIEKLMIDSDDLEPILYGEKHLCPSLFEAAGNEIVNGLIWLGLGKPVLYVNPKVDPRKYVDYSVLFSVFNVKSLKITEFSNQV